VRRALKYELYAFWRRRPVDPKIVFYESFAGNGMLCNPEAIFRALKDDPEFASLRHVWALTSKRDNPSTTREFARDANVRFVRPGTSGYYRALATSGYLINNATFPPEFGKRAGQVYLRMRPWIVAAIVGILVVGALVGIVHVLAAIEESGLVDESLEGD